jgi:type IV pilus assembly protein PilV
MNTQNIVKNQGGVVLLEGLIAVTIFAFGVLAMIGMQASTTRAAGDAKYRVDASFLANQAIGQIWADRVNAMNYDKKSEDFAQLPQGKRVIAVKGTVVNGITQAPFDVTVTVTWQGPGETKAHTHSSITRING